ncbi:MAG: hypothetical protein M3Z56_05410, partial [Bacteroidota bacterium]|nr:hypothetical protein [Bacteroidota bacterium]
MNRNRKKSFEKIANLVIGMLVYLISSIFPMMGNAQEPRYITLQESIDLNIKNSKQLQAAA